jgi:hypothetical protein
LSLMCHVPKWKARTYNHLDPQLRDNEHIWCYFSKKKNRYLINFRYTFLGGFWIGSRIQQESWIRLRTVLNKFKFMKHWGKQKLSYCQIYFQDKSRVGSVESDQVAFLDFIHN